jgi:hypothetical protein
MNKAYEAFTVVCAWCERVMSSSDDETHDERFTHSICEVCFEDMRAEIAKLKSMRAEKAENEKETEMVTH